MKTYRRLVPPESLAIVSVFWGVPLSLALGFNLSAWLGIGETTVNGRPASPEEMRTGAIALATLWLLISAGLAWVLSRNYLAVRVGPAALEFLYAFRRRHSIPWGDIHRLADNLSDDPKWARLLGHIATGAEQEIAEYLRLGPVATVHFLQDSLPIHYDVEDCCLLLEDIKRHAPQLRRAELRGAAGAPTKPPWLDTPPSVHKYAMHGGCAVAAMILVAILALWGCAVAGWLRSWEDGVGISVFALGVSFFLGGFAWAAYDEWRRFRGGAIETTSKGLVLTDRNRQPATYRWEDIVLVVPWGARFLVPRPRPRKYVVATRSGSFLVHNLLISERAKLMSLIAEAARYNLGQIGAAG